MLKNHLSANMLLTFLSLHMRYGCRNQEFTPVKKRKLHGFTLVELVVVITILAILGTIGFLSVGGYSSRTRDSARVADVAQVSKSLDLSVITAGSYPNPDNSFSVTYSGGVVWNQGTV